MAIESRHAYATPLAALNLGSLHREQTTSRTPPPPNNWRFVRERWRRVRAGGMGQRSTALCLWPGRPTDHQPV